jgi:hypothetical protein
MDYLKQILGILFSFVILIGLNMLYILIGRYITNLKKLSGRFEWLDKPVLKKRSLPTSTQKNPDGHRG